MLRAWLTASDVLRILANRKPMVNIVATGGHFAGAVAAAQHAKFIRTLPVDMPLPELVGRLNELQPAILGGYASTIALLAGEQDGGRLSLKPVLVLPIAEGLPTEEYDQIGKVFGSKVRTSYAATECPFLSYSCAEGWLHVNSDWVVLEPVDAHFRPTPPGQISYTVLVSNLANYLQPILRYDLGDAVLQRPSPCPCGNPLPAVRVQGRVADTMTFPDARGHSIRIPSLAMEFDHIPGVQLLQVVQQTPTTLEVRLSVAHHADKTRVWNAVRDELSALLAKHQLSHVAIQLAAGSPQQSPGGKYRTVIPLKKTTRDPHPTSPLPSRL
jgi:phenylacetate-coenzyme A ligase PaaK-like adenylate-forming protein